MKTKIKIAIFLLLISFVSNAQDKYIIKGNFAQAKNTELKLEGFDVLENIILDETKTDDYGNFKLLYPKEYQGAAILKVKDKTSIILLLNKENFEIKWNVFEDFKSIKFTNSPENENFEKGINLYQNAESILAGLKYLKPMYAEYPKDLKWLERQIQIKENILPNFFKNLSELSYAKYYLSIRKFIQDMPITANRYIERMPDHEKQFAQIDFKDERLLHSGLLKELIDSFYLLLESYGDVNKVAEHTQPATEALLKSLDKNENLKQEIAEYLFKLLEKRSLFKSAEQVALIMLNDQNCSLDANKTSLFEQYRKMKIGNQTQDIELTSTSKGINKLSDIKSKYRLVIFGSSWCPKCQEEFVLLQEKYSQWKEAYNLEIIFISLDTETDKYNSFVKNFTWISSCDFKGWETKSAIDYCVFATPTMYLLDTENKILLKPGSTGQLDSWFYVYGKNN